MITLYQEKKRNGMTKEDLFITKIAVSGVL